MTSGPRTQISPGSPSGTSFRSSSSSLTFSHGTARPQVASRARSLVSCSSFFSTEIVMPHSDWPKNWKKIEPNFSIASFSRVGDIAAAP